MNKNMKYWAAGIIAAVVIIAVAVFAAAVRKPRFHLHLRRRKAAASPPNSHPGPRKARIIWITAPMEPAAQPLTTTQTVTCSARTKS